MLRAIVVLLLLAVSFVAYNAYQARITRPPATVLTSPEAAASFDRKVSTAVASPASSAKKPVHLVLTESEITSKIQQSMSTGGSGGLRDVQVKLGSGTAIVNGTADVGGLSVPVEATTRLGAARGLLTVDITSVKAQNMDLPAPLLTQLTDQVKQSTRLKDLQSIDVGVDVVSVVVEPGQIQIDGQTR